MLIRIDKQTIISTDNFDFKKDFNEAVNNEFSKSEIVNIIKYLKTFDKTNHKGHLFEKLLTD